MNLLPENNTPRVEILNFKTFTTEYVAERYGTSETNIRDHKREHADEIVEGIHFIVETNKFRKTAVKWTLRGIIKLGMFIRSKKAKNFRSWAEAELEKSLKKIENELKASRELDAKIKLLESSSDDKYREIFDLRAKLKRQKEMSDARFDAIRDLKRRLDAKTTPELDELRSRARFLEEELERVKRQTLSDEDLNYYRSLESKLSAMQQELYAKERENFDLQREKWGYMQGQAKIINDVVGKLETLYAANKAVQDELLCYISALKKSANEPIKHYLPSNVKGGNDE